LPWFRFRKKKSSDDQTADVPELEAKPELTDPAADAADSESTDPTKPKRRRGSRGGRGRKKPAPPQRAAAPERKEKAEPKQPQRRELSQRRSAAATSRPAAAVSRQRRAPLPAAKRELLVSVDVGERRVAILEDGQVAEVYPRAAGAPLDRRQHLPRPRRQRPARDGGRVRRDRPREERLPLRRRDRQPRARARHGRKIQDLISRGQTILVQAVKDPMKTKGARLTTQISLPGRFVVLVRRARASASRAGSTTTSATA
jgi:hypothetical protein